jgi:hypothetical protein
MNQDALAKKICVICKARHAEPMTFVCKDDKCFQTFMDLQFKGRLKELLGIWGQNIAAVGYTSTYLYHSIKRHANAIPIQMTLRYTEFDIFCYFLYYTQILLLINSQAHS